MTAVPQDRRPWVTVGGLARTLEPGLVLAPDLAGPDLLDAVRRLPASEYVVTDDDVRAPRAGGRRPRPAPRRLSAARPGARLGWPAP